MRAEKLVSGGNTCIPVRKASMALCQTDFFSRIFIIFYIYLDVQGYFVGELMHMRTQTKERRYRCFIYQHFGKGKTVSKINGFRHEASSTDSLVRPPYTYVWMTVGLLRAYRSSEYFSSFMLPINLDVF